MPRRTTARAALARLRKIMENPQSSGVEETRALLAEAEELIGNPRTQPAGPGYGSAGEEECP